MSAITNFFARLVGARSVVRPMALAAAVANDSPQQAPPTYSVTRWEFSDLERALQAADVGDLGPAARIWKACKRDGVIHGVLSTRSHGLVQMPRRFSGDHYAVELQADFDNLVPPEELALLVEDGVGLGVGVAERIKTPGQDYGVLRRLDPEYLIYRWTEDRWYYRSIVGLVPVTPGDGRWVLHVPGGAIAPWQNGLWHALGRAYIAKEHAFYLRENYSQKLANAARVAYSPQGAIETVRRGFFAKLANWGSNPVFDLPPGWDVKLLESNGRGFEVYQETIKTSNEEASITLAGQTVTTDGGAGFQNSNIHATIRSDIIQFDGNAISKTLSEQIVPHWANERFGFIGVVLRPSVAYDTTPQKDQMQEVTALNTFGQSLKSANEGLRPYNCRVDARAMAIKLGVPVLDGSVDVDLSDLSEAA